MSILATRIVSDVKSDFKGGSALSLSWDSLVRRAGRKMLGNINPDNLKLRRAVYGGITKSQNVHYMPSEIVKPSALYKNNGNLKWDFLPPKPFFAKEQVDKFTVVATNTVRFLVVEHDEPGATLLIDDMDDITDMGGTATPLLNDNDYVSGSGAVQSSFTDAGLTFSRTIDTLDISDYLFGTIFLPVRLADASNIATITLDIRTDASKYYRVSTAVDSIASNMIDGWNFLRFSMENRTTTGVPVDTNINSWLLTITTKTGKTVLCVIDRMTLQKNAPLWLEGYSDRLFLDATTGVAKNTLDAGVDSVDIDEELADIFHYELCILVAQSADGSKDGRVLRAFKEQLVRAYENYYENHPSEEEPVSYNIQPELNRRTEPYGRDSSARLNTRDTSSNAT